MAIDPTGFELDDIAFPLLGLVFPHDGDGSETHSPADVTRELLILYGQLADPEASLVWPGYAHREPDKPDDAVTCYDTQGTPDGRDMNTGRVWTHYGVQVRVRAKDAQTGWQKAWALRTFLAEGVDHAQVPVRGRTYLVRCVTRIGDVLPLGYEPGSKRSLFTVNVTVVLRDVTDDID